MISPFHAFLSHCSPLPTLTLTCSWPTWWETMRNIFSICSVEKQTINIALLSFPIRMLLAAVPLSHSRKIKEIKIRNIWLHAVLANKKGLTALCVAKAKVALDFFLLPKRNNRLPGFPLPEQAALHHWHVRGCWCCEALTAPILQ